MTIEKLFGKCPVLPVDSNISLAKYLRNIKQAVDQSNECEQVGDIDRAALLQIRVLQLICKTLPSHPEYQLDENHPVVKELSELAHTGFENIERLAKLLSENLETSAHEARRRLQLRPVEMSLGLAELFERIAAENTARGLQTIGLLAGKPFHGKERTRGTITALVIPSQTSLSHSCDIRYETDVTQLLRVKDLAQLGFIQMCPNLTRLSVSPAAVKMLAPLQQSIPEAVSIIVAPQDPKRLSAFALSDPEGLKFALECISSQRLLASEEIPQGQEGEGGPVYHVAKHFKIRHDADITFKLYDLRPLAAARDEQERSTTKDVVSR